MNKLTITLKQHTPIIHFHDQEGATLRATEVKPKLDRFLIAKHSARLASYIRTTPDDRQFLDYKLRISCASPPKTQVITTQFPCFFAPMGDKYRENKKCFSLTNGAILLNFFCYEPLILELIKNEICHFFAKTNFGTRQSKGFGSFYLADGSIGYLPINKIVSNSISFLYSQSPNDNDLFSDIDLFYKIMKSGFNFPDHQKTDGKLDYDKPKGNFNHYIKSFIHIHFLNKGIGNEKRFIKEKLFDLKVRVPDDNVTKRYVRALLGVADNFEFRGKDHGQERRGKVGVTSQTVDRFQSPVLFKIVGKSVYVIPTYATLPANSSFTFAQGRLDPTILIPEEALDFSDFFRRYVAYLDAERKIFTDKFQSRKKNLPNPLRPIATFFDRVTPTYQSNE